MGKVLGQVAHCEHNGGGCFLPPWPHLICMETSCQATGESGPGDPEGAAGFEGCAQ
jgi:hypothetical protein